MGLMQPRGGPEKQVSVGKGSGSATAAGSLEVLKVMNAIEISYQKEIYGYLKSLFILMFAG